MPLGYALYSAPETKPRRLAMDPNSLKAFLTIVDQGSFSEAAETLHLTQPAISKRLAALENQLGTKLIERGHREIRLTDAGTRLLPHARDRKSTRLNSSHVR